MSSVIHFCRSLLAGDLNLALAGQSLNCLQAGSYNSEQSFLERAPLLLRDWIVGHFPEPLQWLLHHLLSITAILTGFGLFFAFTTIAERKLLARLQNRLGPNRSGLPWFRSLKLWGLTQPFADAIKAITKEDVVPATADKVLHFLAPV